MRERTPFPGSLISRLPNLKLLLTTGQRNASIDLAACAARSIPVAGTTLLTGLASRPAVGSDDVPLPDSTTEHCVAMILALARGIPRDDGAVKRGGWQTGWATCLAGKTLGVVGLGRLGTAVARVMRVGFGMNVIAWSENLTQQKADGQALAAGLPSSSASSPSSQSGGQATFQAVSREELFRSADVVTVHLVLSDRTRGLIGKADLERMKASGFLVNTSRGPLVVEQDLLRTLRAGKIAGAALDVFDLEPLPRDSEWRTTRWGEDGRSEVVLAPHMGYVDMETFDRWYRLQAQNVERWLAGEALEVRIEAK